MSKLPIYQVGGIYHIYNHANGRENLYETEENYLYFLRKYAEKLDGVVKTLAYCLMPNHFHLLVQIRQATELEAFLKAKKEKQKKLFLPENLLTEELHHFIVKRQFHNFLGGYAKAFNKYHNRKGSLLRQNTRRKVVWNERYLVNAILYVHLNPVYHGFTSHPEDWPYSSYHAYLSESMTRIPRMEVLKWFGGKECFVKLHRNHLSKTINPDWEL